MLKPHSRSFVVKRRNSRTGAAATTRPPMGQGMAAFLAQQKMVDNTPIMRIDPLAEKLRQRAVDAILSGTPWISTQQVDELVGGGAANPRAAARLLKQKRVFAIERAGKKEFPLYAFDPFGGPVPALRTILKALDGYTPFRLASWFESPSSILDGRRPREVLATDAAAVLKAAQAHAEGAMHG